VSFGASSRSVASREVSISGVDYNVAFYPNLDDYLSTTLKSDHGIHFAVYFFVIYRHPGFACRSASTRLWESCFKKLQVNGSGHILNGTAKIALSIK
jgi:hypothetical protein